MDNKKNLVVVVAIMSSLVAFLDSSVVNVALPAIEKNLGGGLTLQQWVVNAYLLTLGSFILIAGALSDLLGRKKILQIGLIGFGFASLMCAMAPSGIVLIIARALQGFFGALLVPSSLALIISAFSGKQQSKAIGQWTAWTGISFIIGPVLGGFLVDIGSWRWVFAINVIPIGITLWLLAKLNEPAKTRKDSKVDYIGAVLCSAGLAALVFALIEQTNRGLQDSLIIFMLASGTVLFSAFLYYENFAKNPMLPLELFKVRNFWVGNLATTSIYAGLSVATFLIVIFVQQIGGYTALQAGMSLLPITFIMFFLSSRFGMLAGKYGPRLFMSLGPIIGGVGFLLLLNVNEDLSYWTQLLPGIVVFGFGLSMTVAPLTSAVLSDIKKEHSGIGSAVNNAISRIAGLIATAAIGILLTSDLQVDGFKRGVIAMALPLFIGGLISAIGIRNNTKSG